MLHNKVAFLREYMISEWMVNVDVMHIEDHFDSSRDVFTMSHRLLVFLLCSSPRRHHSGVRRWSCRTSHSSGPHGLTNNKPPSDSIVPCDDSSTDVWYLPSTALQVLSCCWSYLGRRCRVVGWSCWWGAAVSHCRSWLGAVCRRRSWHWPHTRGSKFSLEWLVEQSSPWGEARHQRTKTTVGRNQQVPVVCD